MYQTLNTTAGKLGLIKSQCEIKLLNARSILLLQFQTEDIAGQLRLKLIQMSKSCSYLSHIFQRCCLKKWVMIGGATPYFCSMEPLIIGRMRLEGLCNNIALAPLLVLRIRIRLLQQSCSLLTLRRTISTKQTLTQGSGKYNFLANSLQCFKGHLNESIVTGCAYTP